MMVKNGSCTKFLLKKIFFFPSNTFVKCIKYNDCIDKYFFLLYYKYLFLEAFHVLNYLFTTCLNVLLFIFVTIMMGAFISREVGRCGEKWFDFLHFYVHLS